MVFYLDLAKTPFIPKATKTKLDSTTTKFVTKSFKRHNIRSFAKLCKILYLERLFAERGAFKQRWMFPLTYLVDDTYISYLSVRRKPVGVAYIMRGDTFNFICDSKSEGFISCYIKPEYRGLGYADRLIKNVILEGGFKHVSGLEALRKSTSKIEGVTFYLGRDD